MVNSEDDRSGALLIDPTDREFALVELRRLISEACPVSSVVYTDRTNVFEEQVESARHLHPVNGLKTAVLRAVERIEPVDGHVVRPGWSLYLSGTGAHRAQFHSAHLYDVDCELRIVP